MVTGALGGLGLLLASIGLYGIISYSVSRRAREIGVRMALGARAMDVQRMVVRSGMRLAALGVMLGLVLAVGASRLLVAFLYGVSPLDAPTFLATSALFVAVAFLASYLPARRAALADPLVALRSS
ncbi:MAG: permease [Gemmatimonadetes bacterium]|nr:permease [Gemmatimonadota bacterium]